MELSEDIVEEKKEMRFRWGPFPTELFFIIMLLGLFAAFGAPVAIGLYGMELQGSEEVAAK